MNYLPKEILYRKKEAFSDGVSNESRSWYKIIQEHLEKPKYKNYFDESSNLTKEQQYYKKIFEEYYPNKTSVIPYYWMPKWTNTTDPSARTL
jgi:asparagine synthase (glutamine-hydrolysing)